MPLYRDNPLDETVNTELMRVCKCVVPYLDSGVQKNVAIGLKFLELINTINTFSGSSTLSPPLSLTRQGNWQEELLHNVRSNLSPDKAYLVDALIKLQDFKSILNTKEMPSFTTPPDNDFAPFFSPNNPLERENTEPIEEPLPKKPSQNQGPSPSSILQALSPMLDDNQKQLLGLLSTFLNTNK